MWKVIVNYDDFLRHEVFVIRLVKLKKLFYMTLLPPAYVVRREIMFLQVSINPIPAKVGTPQLR